MVNIHQVLRDPIAPKCCASWCYFFHATSCLQDCTDIWTQSWEIERINQQNESSAWMELGTCEASLSVAMHETPNPDAEAERLNLSIPSWPQLSPKDPIIQTMTRAKNKVR